MGENKWLLAFRYDDVHTAGEAYELGRDLVFRPDINASVYRIRLNTVPHIVIVIVGDCDLSPPARYSSVLARPEFELSYPKMLLPPCLSGGRRARYRAHSGNVGVSNYKGQSTFCPFP